MFNCTPVFYANKQSKAKVKINQGGTYSSKTVSILQLLVIYAVYNPGWIITVTGESMPNLKKGAYRDLERLYNGNAYFRSQVKFWNRSNFTFYFKNGALIEFITNLDEQTAKSGKRQVLFVNEAQGIPWPIFFQLAMRTDYHIFIDYNPTAPFWAHDMLIGTTPEQNELSSTVELIISDHRHNCFLSEEQHRKIEGIKDPETWRVYARGLTGNLTGIIFPNMTKIPDAQFPWAEPFFGGLDFGYTNDPTAGVKLVRLGESIFAHEMCYTPGIAPRQMKEIFQFNGFGPETPMYCEHDTDNIRQLRQMEMLAIPARKGQGSVNAGIIKMKEYKLYYTASSTNIDNERKRYVWINDPITGKPTNTPIDQFNHLMDAERMGVYTHFYRA